MKFREVLNERLAGVLDWYIGCDVCSATLANVNRDLESVLSSVALECGIKKKMPYVFRARFEGADIVVHLVSWSVS